MTPSATQMPIHPRTNAHRTPLPAGEFNPKLREVAASANGPAVKFQIILREGQEIVVGRVKVPTPAGHAFILRRFDTGAISLSTMFRACYPSASDEAEKAEMNWVKTNFDTSGSNGGGKLRLAGTWVPTNVAGYLAADYGLSDILPALVQAEPEPRAAYRKSGKSGASSSLSASGIAANGSVNGAASAASLIPTSLPPTSSTTPKGTPTKRVATSPARQPAPKKARKSVSPAPPALKPPVVAQPTRSSPRKAVKTQEENTEDEEPEVLSVDPEEDIAEAKEEVQRLRAEHLAAQAHREKAAGIATPVKNNKRTIETVMTPPFRLDLEKIATAGDNAAMDITSTRPIINRRRLANLPPTRKAAAWGGLAFFLGLGASALLPSLPSLLPGGGYW